ncbi:hypothetical protein DAI22_08g148700 [Oryza sativa Japonica Group]|nr:hypothetical protein DAI22_08g148700 [Oryza sativa Japonica Group]
MGKGSTRPAQRRNQPGRAATARRDTRARGPDDQTMGARARSEGRVCAAPPTHTTRARGPREQAVARPRVAAAVWSVSRPARMDTYPHPPPPPPPPPPRPPRPARPPPRKICPFLSHSVAAVVLVRGGRVRCSARASVTVPYHPVV